MKKNIILLLRIISAAILMQTLFFKFTGAAESKYIFTTVGAEPWGRWASGIVELIASILLLVPSTYIFGAIAGAGVMVGAILSHLAILGIVVMDDGGLLFTLACTVFVSCSIIIIAHKNELEVLIKKVFHVRL